MADFINEIQREAAALRALRANGNEAKAQENKQFLDDLKHDSKIIVDAFLEIIKKRSTICYSYPNPVLGFTFFDVHIEIHRMVNDKLKSGVKVRTFFTGFWSRFRGRFDVSKWQEAGIGLIVPEVNKRLQGSGIEVTDISDRAKSMKLVLQVTIPELDFNGN